MALGRAHADHSIDGGIWIIVNASVVELSPERETANRAAVSIQRVGAHMTRTLEDLLDFASFHAGKPSLVFADMDIVKLVRDAVLIHEVSAGTRRVSLLVDAPHETLVIRGDQRRIARMLVNVIGNALKYTPDGGRVDVVVSEAGDECETAVRDTGVGIPEDQLETIFERFQQVRTNEPRPYGVGLGLYITRLIAGAHGGRVWAESKRGEGSTFRIRLPVASTRG